MISKKEFSLSLFLPCFNEEANVEPATRAAVAACQAVSEDFEIIIVNDGSLDGTGKIADCLAAEIPQVRVVHHPRNLGYGAALQSGFRAARKDWIFYTDGDGQFDLSELSLLLALLDEYDIVSAYRVNRRESGHRRLFAWGWTQLVNRVFQVQFRDIDCAFKLYPRSLFEQIEMRAQGALIDTEILVKARNLGYRIGQIGVQHYPRRAGVSTGASPRVVLRAFQELLLLSRSIRATHPSAVKRVASTPLLPGGTTVNRVFSR